MDNLSKASRFRFRAWDPNYPEMFEVKDINFNSSVSNPFTVFGNNGEGLDAKDGVILMQSTGLTDKNGKEIYERDIIQWPNTVRGMPAPSEDSTSLPPKVVTWDIQGSCHGWACSHIGFHDVDTQCEVIGNIYESPSLLK